MPSRSWVGYLLDVDKLARPALDIQKQLSQCRDACLALVHQPRVGDVQLRSPTAILHPAPSTKLFVSNLMVISLDDPALPVAHQQTHTGRVNETAFGLAVSGDEESALLASVGDDGVVAIRKLGEDSYCR